jgi:serine phosphatase RsbU (regulator of sigma subunit)
MKLESIPRIILILIASFLNFVSYSQGFDNKTRALYILDISKYVKWPEEVILKQEFFTIGVLDPGEELFWEIENMGKTRKYIQGKPIKVFIFKEPGQIKPSNVLYVNKKNQAKLEPVLNIISGKHTLLISEGYEFRESMLNFLFVNNQPRFEVNQELLKREGLEVSESFLALAVKTREDWEKLFNVTDTMLQVEKEITQQQKIIINEQDCKIKEQEELIKKQFARLDSLDREIGKKQITINQKERILLNQEKEIGQQKGVIRDQVKQVSDQKKSIETQQGEIAELEKERQSKEILINQQDSRINQQLKEIEKQKLITYFVVVALILVTSIGYFIYINYRNKKKANEILEDKNRLITAQKDEIKQQKDIAEMQRDQIAYQKKHITDSIHYALRIQRAILPSLELFSDEIDHFVLYKPRDIVSGDFYWVHKKENVWIVIASDCTGHGVPGAFMSMLGISFLNEIVISRNIRRPDLILNALRDSVIKSLKQHDIQSDVKDGMDITVCTIDYTANTLEFAGANNPLFLVQNGDLNHIKGDKMPVAVHADMQPFTLNTFKISKGDTFYTFSDGFVDQFGGPYQKKFLTKNFKEAIMKMQDKSMYDQGMSLDRIFEDWKKEVDQVDDVTLIGIRY